MALRIKRPTFDSNGVWGVIYRLFIEAGVKHLAGYGIAMLFLLLVAGTTALSAWIVKDVVDQVFVDRNLGELFFLSIAVVVISALRGLSLYGSTVTLSRIANGIAAETQGRLYNHMLKLGMDFYDRTHSSQLVTRLTFAVNSAGELLNTVLTSFGRDLLTLIGLVAVMVIQSPMMSVIALLVGPIAFGGVSRLVKRMRGVSNEELQGNAMIISVMQETSIGIRILKAFNLESAMQSRMHEAVQDVRHRKNLIASIKARTNPLMETLGGFAVAGVMLWAGYATVLYEQKPGAFMSFMTAILFAYDPAKRLANTRVALERGVVAARMIFSLLDTKPTLSANEDGPDLEIDRGEVVFEKVSFAYRRKVRVLTKFDFRAEAGTVTALVGPSGSGKSTIISLIERFYDVSGGRVLIDGQDIAKVRLASLRDQVALVTQDTIVFRASIRENIRYGRPSATDAEVEEAARNAMAHDFIMALPNGYDTMLDDGETQLSGGQRQRVTIARAMLRDAKIILLDEATSALDSESEHQVQIAFDRLMSGRTTIVIAHRLSTVLGADRICVLVDGEIVENGRHAELLSAGKHYARLYHLQFERAAANDGAAPEVAAE
jgi:ATP-binding cassette subfamily B protein